MSFVHLHTHSEYSLLDGASRVKDIVKKAKLCGFPAAALTDHGVMYGVYEFYKECKAAQIKPIIGCEVYVAPRSRLKKEGKQDAANYHLILLVKNEIGYKNLIKLVSLADIEGFYHRPRIDMELLQEFHEGLICLSACVAGQVPTYLLENRYAEAKDLAKQFQAMFGEDYYLEIQNHGLPEQLQAVPLIQQLGAELNIPIVVTNDSHYTEANAASSQDTLMCISQGKVLSDTNRMKFLSDQLYYKTAPEMQALFPDHPEYLSNALKIAEKINFEYAERNYLPKFKVPDGYDEPTYLTEKTWEGIKERYGDPIPEQVRKRVEYELAVIIKMGFAGYFLIVSDFIRWGKQRGISIGPGRGSAAGSIVSYAMDITTLEPLRYNLLFERFLNPERISMPDIDIDFCIRRREEVIEYVREKYGRPNVAQIVTFQTMAAKRVIRDVARVMNIPLGEADRIAKMIPDDIGISIAKALEQNPELKAMYDGNGQTKELLNMGMQLEGFSRDTGTHAAGVVISEVPLMDIIPLKKVDESIVTQFTMTEIEELGLLKMDFLGLRNLTMIDDCLRLIERNHGLKLNLDKMAFDDQKAFEIFRTGDTVGIFQCESKGMRAMIRKIQPSCFEDIIAILALYRPGPLNSGMVDQFIERKHGRVEISYAFPELEPYLKDTYGLIIYQEQVMQIASVIGGFSMAQADNLRKAMGKKKAEIMAKLREEFVRGAVQTGHNKKAAEDLYDMCAKFAEYGFNKSHSAAYAVISYRTAWLKAHYPLEFMAALLSSVSDDEAKVREYINDCSRMGMEVLAPSVNESDKDFAAVNGAIRFGLSAIKNVGENAIDALMAERAKAGIFTSFSNLCYRIDLKTMNKKTVEALAMCGALDVFGKRRAIVEGYAPVMEKISRMKREKENGQESLFIGMSVEQSANIEDAWPDVPEYLPEEKLQMERELLGLFVSSHPLKHVGVDIESMGDTVTTEIPEKPEETLVKVAGMLKNVRKIITKTQKFMAVAVLEDLRGSIPVVCFPRDYEKLQELIVNDMIAVVSGKVSISRDEHQIVIATVEPIANNRGKQTLFIDLEAVEDVSVLQELKETLGLYRGSMPVVLHTTQADITLDQALWVRPEPELRQKIDSLIGSGRSWLS